MSPVDGVPVAPSAPEPVNYQPLPGTTQTAYMTPPGAYPQQQVVYPPGTQTVIMAQPAPVYVQQMQRPAGYNDGLCSCGHDLGPAHWTIVAWVLCLCFCKSLKALYSGTGTFCPRLHLLCAPILKYLEFDLIFHFICRTVNWCLPHLDDASMTRCAMLTRKIFFLFSCRPI